MKVLIVSQNFPPNVIGGAEIVAHQLAHSLLLLGHHVTVIAGDVSGLVEPNIFICDTESEPFPVTRIGLAHSNTSWEYANFSRPDLSDRISALLREAAPDVVHCHNLVGLGVEVVRIARDLGIPCMLTLHDHWPYCHRQTLVNTSGLICDGPNSCFACQPSYIGNDGSHKHIETRNEAINYHLSSLSFVAAPSQFLLECFRSYTGLDIPGKKVSNGRPSFSKRLICDKPNQTFPRVYLTFGFASYFGEHKGIFTLLDAVRSLVDVGYSGFRVLMAGDGHEKSRFASLIHDLELQDFFELVGKLPHSSMHEFYKAVDVFMLPSLWPENQPCTIMEACAFGLPIIASDLGGVPEIVGDYVNGRLVSAGSFVELADAMRLFIDNPALITAFSRQSMALASRESYSNMALEYESIYMSILAE